MSKIDEAPSSKLNCHICMNEFDIKDHRPKILKCGHTLCLTCIISLNRNQRTHCPWCREPIKVVADNLLALEIIQDSSFRPNPKEPSGDKLSENTTQSSLRCPEHNQEYILFCVSCDRLICGRCATEPYGQHHGTEHFKIDLEKAFEQLKYSELEQIQKIQDLAIQIKSVHIDHLEFVQKLVLKTKINVLNKMDTKLRHSMERMSRIQKEIQESVQLGQELISSTSNNQCEVISTAKSNLFQLYEEIRNEVSDIESDVVYPSKLPNTIEYINKVQESQIKNSKYKDLQTYFLNQLLSVYSNINGSREENRVIKIDLPTLDDEYLKIPDIQCVLPKYETKEFIPNENKVNNPFGFGPGVKKRFLKNS